MCGIRDKKNGAIFHNARPVARLTYAIFAERATQIALINMILR